MSPENTPQCTLIDRFSFTEKLLMRTGWTGFMAVGAYGIYRQDPFWALLYVVFGILGFVLVVLPGLCAHCPYPYRYDTCLFQPPGLLKTVYSYKGPRMSLQAKIAVGATLGGMAIFPNYWLIQDQLVLLVFWIIALPVLLAFPLHYCTRCRHAGCPMNRAFSKMAGQKR